MENVMTNGFIELSENEMLDIDGGKSWLAVAGGVALGVITGIGVAAAAPIVAAGGAAAGGIGCVLAGCSAVSGGLIGGGLWG